MPLFERPSREPLPEPDFEDVKHAAGKGLVSLIPGLGEAWGLVIATPLEERRSDWLRDLESRLRELEDRIAGFSFEKLGEDAQFVSATLQATQSALRTHQQGKLVALKSAVINVVLGRERDADRQLQFLAIVDRFSEIHLAVLRFFDDPASYYLAIEKPVPVIRPPSMKPVIKLLAYQLIADAMPLLIEQIKSPRTDRPGAAFQFVESILSDLVSAKFIALERNHETWDVPKFDNAATPTPVKRLTTHLGEDFLSFITDSAPKNNVGASA